MNTIVTITPNYQVHIPTKMRKMVGLDKHGPAEMMVEDGKIILKPLDDQIMKLAGKYKSKKKINVDKVRDRIDYSKL